MLEIRIGAGRMLIPTLQQNLRECTRNKFPGRKG
jgi:hypothetical protein